MPSLNSGSNGDSSVNRLLATLPKNEYNRLLPKLTTVRLVLGEELYEPGRFFVNTRSGAGLGHSHENEFSGCTYGSKPAWQFSSPPASLFALTTNSGLSIICVQPLSFG